MTYKNIIENIVKEKAQDWICSFCMFDIAMPLVEKITVNIRKDISQLDGDTCHFEVDVRMLNVKTKDCNFTVRGTIGEYGKIYLSEIRNNKNETVWHASEKVRQVYGIIEKFRII